MLSWGQYPRQKHAKIYRPAQPADFDEIFQSCASSVLPRGLGRSYGDVCLNEDGALLLTSAFEKSVSFDQETGVLSCGAGLSFDEVLKIIIPAGWFLPVTPGTRFVTLGGAIANDVHGKNHHQAGSFGNHVKRLELLRSDGTRLTCSRDQNGDWFQATVGGLGLTGVILRAEIQLKKIESSFLSVETEKFENPEEFFELSSQAGQKFEYTVAWLDCNNIQKNGGRGVFLRGNHCRQQEPKETLTQTSGKLRVPFNAPSFLLSRPTLKLFNFLYYHRQREKIVRKNQHYAPFFYPLDQIGDWNRLYGRRGFLQWQCVAPPAKKQDVLRAVLKKISQSGLGSFLAVLKEFGEKPSEGLLSFPTPGVTLALDFPNVGKPLFKLLDDLDAIICDASGRIYPAKDARMSPETFRASFPNIDAFEKFIDPKFSSSFYRRVRP